jgi:hypothetical protein
MKEGTEVDITQGIGPYRIYGTVKKFYGILVIEVSKNYYVSLCLNVTAEKQASSRGDNGTGWIVSYDRNASNHIPYKEIALREMDKISETQYKRTKVQVSIPNEEIVVKFRT